MKRPPDGIFCANDLMAFGVMDTARGEFGLSIPRDLKVCGFDNSDLSGWSSYALTSVDQDIPAMVETAIAQIVDFLSGKTRTSRHFEVTGRLVVRSSTMLRDIAD